MPPDNRLFEDFARVANGALGAMAGLRSEIETMMRGAMDRLVNDLKLVGRDELDGVRDVAVASREAQEELSTRLRSVEERLERLEGHIAALSARLAAEPSQAPLTAAAKPGRRSRATPKAESE